MDSKRNVQVNKQDKKIAGDLYKLILTPLIMLAFFLYCFNPTKCTCGAKLPINDMYVFCQRICCILTVVHSSSTWDGGSGRSRWLSGLYVLINPSWAPHFYGALPCLGNSRLLSWCNFVSHNFYFLQTRWTVTTVWDTISSRFAFVRGNMENCLILRNISEHGLE